MQNVLREICTGFGEGNVKDGDCFEDRRHKWEDTFKIDVKEQMRGRGLGSANSEYKCGGFL